MRVLSVGRFVLECPGKQNHEKQKNRLDAKGGEADISEKRKLIA